MIRFILVIAFVIVFLILSIPVIVVESLIGKFNLDLKNKQCLGIVQWAFRVILWMAGVKVTTIGEENIPVGEPVLYVGNHRSYFDILITYVRVKGLTGYMSKMEVKRIPLLRDWMKALHCQFIDRTDVKQGLKVILDCIELIKTGISVCVFPEGTRNREEGTFLPFHEGSFKIATKTNCAIVPMTLNNAGAIFEDHIPYVKKTHVVLEYGKPIYPKDLSKEELKHVGSYVQNIIMETHEKNKALV